MKRLALILILPLLLMGAARDVTAPINAMFHKERFLFKPNNTLVGTTTIGKCLTWYMYGGYSPQACTADGRILYYPYRDVTLTKMVVWRTVQATVAGDCTLEVTDGADTILWTDNNFSNRPFNTYEEFTIDPPVTVTAPDTGAVPGATDGMKVVIRDGTTGTCTSTGQVPWIVVYFYGYYIESPYNYVR